MKNDLKELFENMNPSEEQKADMFNNIFYSNKIAKPKKLRVKKVIAVCAAVLILSTISVFLRDMFYIYGIVLTILTYFTPIMYDINILDSWIQRILKLNPLYHYITFARTIILYNQIPSLKSFVICGVSAVVVLIIGVVIFKKNQDKFIYYM